MAQIKRVRINKRAIKRELSSCRSPIEDYLISAREVWKEKQDTSSSREDRLIATAYLDAYESVYVTLFGSLPP